MTLCVAGMHACMAWPPAERKAQCMRASWIETGLIHAPVGLILPRHASSGIPRRIWRSGLPVAAHCSPHRLMTREKLVLEKGLTKEQKGACMMKKKLGQLHHHSDHQLGQRHTKLRYMLASCGARGLSPGTLLLAVDIARQHTAKWWWSRWSERAGFVSKAC